MKFIADIFSLEPIIFQNIVDGKRKEFPFFLRVFVKIFLEKYYAERGWKLVEPQDK
ncbi:hypothetical protein U14_00281 [Candidatus Moduliflexus flocculans]|uniref:Uncharacterized protein n=1 Tax=Candidatus Moduliflexus flocculans TaxID=1499966 RepID=A0A0S6VQ20_9BACT|nr:hypothetical protein U14_00281 [Candidatus Moduliflexus flocculans]